MWLYIQLSTTSDIFRSTCGCNTLHRTALLNLQSHMQRLLNIRHKVQYCSNLDYFFCYRYTPLLILHHILLKKTRKTESSMQASGCLRDNRSLGSRLCHSCCGHALYNETQQHSGSGNIHLTPSSMEITKEPLKLSLCPLCFRRITDIPTHLA